MTQNPVPWVITYKNAAGLKPGQSRSSWGFCPGTMLGGGNQLLGAQVVGTLLSLSGHLDTQQIKDDQNQEFR